MKKVLSIFSRLFSTFLFCLIFSLSTVYVTVTGLKLAADPYFLIPAALIFSFLTALPYIFKKGWPGQLILLLIFGFLSIRYFVRIQEGIMLLTMRVSEAFHFTFAGVPEVTFPDLPKDATVNWFLSFAIMLLCWSGAAGFNRELSLICPVSLTLPFLVVCLLPLNTTPHYLPLACLALSYLYLTFASSRIFKKGSAEGYRLLLLIPGLILTGLVTYLTHPEDYKKPEWTKAFQTFYNRATAGIPGVGPFGEADTLGTEPWNRSRDLIDLKDVGPMEKMLIHVMDVQTDRNAVLYLKGTALTTYQGQSWTNDIVSNSYTPGKAEWIKDQPSKDTVTIITDDLCSVLYTEKTLTELPGGSKVNRDLSLTNRRHIRKYTEYLTDRPLSLNEDYINYVRSNYTTLPDRTREGLTSYIQGNDLLYPYLTLDPAYFTGKAFGGVSYLNPLVSAVTGTVKATARYDLQTPAMPENEDFVLWFLNQQDTGYCIHFASAAAALLRVFGVPSRLVTGYLVQNVQPDQDTPVYQSDAHAWVEYFDETKGWITLDVTPGVSSDNSSPANPDANVPSETIPTLPWENESREIKTRSETEAETDSVPEGGAEDGAEEGTGKRDHASSPFRLPSYLILLIPAFFIFLWFEIRMLIRVRITGNSDNHSATLVYRRLSFLSRVSGIEIPKKAEKLALKARFSNQTLTGKELNDLRREYYYFTERLKSDPSRIKAFLYRIFLFL